MASRLGPIRLWFMASALIICSAAPASCSGHTYNGPVQTINFGDLSTDSSLFIYIAQQQNYFAQNGINLTVKDYTTGPLVTQALVDGEIDLATAGEYSAIVQLMAGANLQILCSMDYYRSRFLVARTDLGITTAASLKGKKIGLVQNSLPEFYLGRFLTLNGLSLSDVIIVNTAPADWASAISSGAVDAVVVNQATLADVEAQLAGKYVAWDVQNYQESFGLLFCTGAWLDQNGPASGRFLKALAQAEVYLTGHQAECKTLLQRKFGYSDSYMAALWPEHNFSLSLSQSLVTAMEDEARWMAANGLSTQTTIPDFMKNMYPAGLAALKPEAVHLG